MHKYFNFAKIYEAETTGKPLTPAEMGTPEASTQIAQVPTEKLEDFEKLAQSNVLEITLTPQDIVTLKGGESVIKEKSAKWKNKENETEFKVVEKVIFNTRNETQQNDPEALVFMLDDTKVKEIIDGIDLGNLTQVLTGTGQDGTIIKDVTVRFIKEVNPDVTDAETVTPASPAEITSGAVTPDAKVGELPNESKKIMNFDQFVNEGKKKWIGEINMKKGALKKEMGDDSLSMADLNKEEAKLKKKDKDKKKPGIQLDAKDAKTRKRVTLAKNLMKASGAAKK